MPQLHLNQGPQDSLLYDNSRSYFTNVGYVRTSNFQMELRDVQPQNAANFGSTVSWVIPKSGDLLGPVDLMFDIEKATGPTSGLSSTTGVQQFASWVDNLGYACIDRIVFSVGSNDIETITGDQLAFTNELMKDDAHRLGPNTIMRTGRPAVYRYLDTATAHDQLQFPQNTYLQEKVGRGIFHHVGGGATTFAGSGPDQNSTARSLIVPLGLFFTKHPSQYFPLAAIAGCNDVRIAITFKTLNQLVQLNSSLNVETGNATATLNGRIAAGGFDPVPPMPTWPNGANPLKSGTMRLRCHYIHTTGPEATTLMNKEHVRLLKLYSVNTQTFTVKGSPSATPGMSGGAGQQATWPINLSFLHPVTELIITIRKVNNMNSATVAGTDPNAADQQARMKNYFAYHGKGKRTRGGGTNVGDPNVDNPLYLSSWQGKSVNTIMAAAAAQNPADDYICFKSMTLTLNGQDRMPSLASAGSGTPGISRDYLMNRMMPMLHSNAKSTITDIASSSVLCDVAAPYVGATAASQLYERQSDLMTMGDLLDRKDIYVYPFCLNPEGANPSGSVNFSKVSHAVLTLYVDAFSNSGGGTTGSDVEYQVDVYACYYNWLQIKDGRALLSFA